MEVNAALLTLLGNGAIQSLDAHDLDNWEARMFSIGPSLSIPIFSGGRLSATLALRNAQQKKAAIAYQKTVLTAFHEVDHALTAFRAEQLRFLSLNEAATNQQLAWTLAQERYREGLSSFLDVLTAERDLLDAQLEATDSAQNVTLGMAQLYKALGGGWEIHFSEERAP